jgi:hypothetical protein
MLLNLFLWQIRTSAPRIKFKFYGQNKGILCTIASLRLEAVEVVLAEAVGGGGVR